MHKKLIAILITGAGLVGSSMVAEAESYSTEATMSLQKEKGIVNVSARIVRLVEQDGKVVEEVLSQPRIETAPGVPANMYVGVATNAANYATTENIRMEASWPYPNESGTAFCVITIRRGDMVLSRSKFQLKVEEPGRLPLVIGVAEVNPKSVRLADEKPQTCVLFEFARKTKNEVKTMARDNYGNRVRIRYLQGGMTEGGHSFGTYKENGMALQFESEKEAERVAGILRRELQK